MNVVELMEIALANTDEGRVEVFALEPALVSTRAVAGLAQLTSELVANAAVASGPEEKVVVTGLFDDNEAYLVSISDRGAGTAEDGAAVLNRLLSDPESTLRLASIARLADRHGLTVRFVPGARGPTARVTVPADLVGEVDTDEHRSVVDLTRYEPASRAGRYVPQWGSRAETEAFLEEVFSPLMEDWEVVAPSRTATVLRMRVPGESFSLTEEDAPSTAPAEAAVDIRSALTTFDHGRRLAELTADGDEEHSPSVSRSG